MSNGSIDLGTDLNGCKVYLLNLYIPMSCYYDSHFMDNETEVKRITHLSNVSDRTAGKEQSSASSLAVWL